MTDAVVVEESVRATSSSPEAIPADEMRARKHPLALLSIWLYELAAGYVIATPLHAWARSSFGSHPYGDEPLFRPGGYALLSWLDTTGPEVGIVFRSSALLLIVFGLASIVATSALVAILATRGGKRLSFALRVGGAAFFPSIAAAIIFGAIEGFFLGVGFFVSSAADHHFQDGWGDQRAFLARLVVLSLFLGLTLASGVVGDLARVAIARNIAQGTAERPLREGLVAALRTARRKLGRAFLAWGWRSAIATTLIAAGAALSDLTHGRAGGALWLLFFAHQGIIFVRAALRASWLANALRLIDDAEPGS